jgi:hypothetical protein
MIVLVLSEGAGAFRLLNASRFYSYGGSRGLQASEHQLAIKGAGRDGFQPTYSSPEGGSGLVGRDFNPDRIRAQVIAASCSFQATAVKKLSLVSATRDLLHFFIAFLHRNGVKW